MSFICSLRLVPFIPLPSPRRTVFDWRTSFERVVERGTGFIFVQYYTMTDAEACIQQLNNTTFRVYFVSSEEYSIESCYDC